MMGGRLALVVTSSPEPQGDPRLVLVPWLGIEACEVAFAAAWADVTPQCVRRWCERHALGRLVGGRWKVSRLAFPMWLENDRATLARYHRGDRLSPEVAAYWPRMQFPRR